MRHDWIAPLALGLGLAAASGTAGAFGQDSLVWKKCGTCHAPAADGRIPRVEDLRTTPEEWTVIVDRMRRLHGMTLKSGEMDGLLKELTATQLLTPDEQAQVSYLSLWHNSQQVETPADKDEEKALRHLRALPHGGQDPLVPDDARGLGEAARLPPLHRRRRSSSRCARCAGFPRPTRCSRTSRSGCPTARRGRRPRRSSTAPGACSATSPAAARTAARSRIADAGNAEYKLTGSLAYADGTVRDLRRRGHALRRLRAAHADEEQRLRRQRRLHRLRRRDPRRMALSRRPDFRTSGAQWLRIGDGARVARIAAGVPAQGREDHAHRRGREPARRQGRRHRLRRGAGQGAGGQAPRARRARAPGGEPCREARRRRS